MCPSRCAIPLCNSGISLVCPRYRARTSGLLDLQSLCDTHGLLGAVKFMMLQDCVMLSEHNAMTKLSTEWPGVTIMMHDMVKAYWGSRNPQTEQPEHAHLQLVPTCVS